VADINALLFDFGGTLDGPAHWLDRFLANYRAAGVEISRAELDPAFDHATRIGYGATKVITRFGLTDLVRFIVGHQFEHLRQGGPPKVRALLDDRGAKGRHRIVESITTSFVRETSAGMEHSRGVLATLEGRFKMGVVSNFYGNLDRILADARLERFFAAVADSSRVGIFKPETGIFEAALKKMDCASESAAKKTAMIGDSLAKDCAPAKKLGLKTVWLRTDSSRPVPEGAGALADVTIGSIDQIAQIAQIQW
jgi:HAD superfamily hydrolase (TIGR01549 family)